MNNTFKGVRVAALGQIVEEAAPILFAGTPNAHPDDKRVIIIVRSPQSGRPKSEFHFPGTPAIEARFAVSVDDLKLLRARGGLVKVSIETVNKDTYERTEFECDL